MWLGSIEIAEKKFEQKSAPVYIYMFTHESNLIVPDTNHRLGAAHATEIWYKFNNVDVEGPKDPTRPSLIGTDPDRKKTVGHVRWDRSPGRQGATLLAGLHHAKTRHDDDRCAMQS